MGLFGNLFGRAMASGRGGVGGMGAPKTPKGPNREKPGGRGGGLW